MGFYSRSEFIVIDGSRGMSFFLESVLPRLFILVIEIKVS